MIALGIESTAHTFGVGIVSSDGNILANVSDSYVSVKGGMRPFDLAEHHSKVAPRVVRSAFKEAQISKSDIDLVGFSQGPGIGQALAIGGAIARMISQVLKVPLVGVNHPIAHIEIGRLVTGAIDPLIVYISGGNTQIIAHVEDRYCVLGETLDIGFGNAQEKLGRIIGLPFPAGPHMDRIEGRWIDLPYTVKGMDLAFSGIVTEAERRIGRGERVEDVVWSFMEVCLSMITEVSERALAHTRKKELMLVGGVAASPKLREKLKIMCEDRGVKFSTPPPSLARDNGAMIAWTAILAHQRGEHVDIEASHIRSTWRLDDLVWPLIDLNGC